MFVELKNENSKQINALKEIIEKKDEKIISLENQVKQVCTGCGITFLR